MSFRTAAFFAVSALLATSNAHITMEKPVPYSVDKIDSSPIAAAGYPCKVQNGFTVSTMNNMKVGETQQISFKGTAVHGGGSCQLSYTQDTTPTANSKFKVIKSIEGGCPGVDGVKSFDFTLPDSIPNGKGTFAWTWFAKLSGAPEMYMNCAPIDVTGGASDASGLDALPDMLIANIATTTCKSPLNKALKFPSPGSEVQAGGTSDVEAPTGECGASSGPSPPADSDSPAPPSGPSAPASGPSPTEPAAGPSTGGAAPTNPGGVFAPGASSTSTQTTLATVTAPAPGTDAPAAPTGGAPAAPTGGAPAGPTGGSPAAPTGAPSSGTPPSGSPSTGGGSSCSQNGAIVCNGPDQFGLCNNGSVVFMPVASGTKCEGGAITKRGYNGRIARPRAAVAY